MSGLLLGIVLGAVTGLPIGIVNATIVQAAVTNRVRFAIGVGLGGALADGIHATIAFAGIGRLPPDVACVAALGAAVAAITYVALHWRTRAQPIAADDRSSLARGIPVGLAFTLPNPGALTAWFIVAAGLGHDFPPVLVGIGVAVGSAAWFTVLARFVAKRRTHRLVRALPRVALVAIAALVMVGVARAL